MIVQLPHAAEQTQQTSNAPKMSLINHDSEAFANKLQRLTGGSSSREQQAINAESNDSSYADVSRRSLICLTAVSARPFHRRGGDTERCFQEPSMRRQPSTRHGCGSHPGLFRRVGQQLGEKGSLSERGVSEREAQPDGEGAQVSR